MDLRGFTRFAALIGAFACGSALAQATPAQAEAARLLTQATFGPTTAEIERVLDLGVEGWLNDQLNRPATLHRPELEGPGGINAALADITSAQRQEIWWRYSLNAPDQLRQRVAFALSEILVVSEDHTQLHDKPLLLAEYYDILLRNAFGNYRQLLQEVTLSPAMGLYLSMLRNDKPHPATGRRPDENFAREVQQLFSIGLHQLNRDGSVRLDAGGKPLPTYGQEDIEHFARAFTGWTWADAGTNWNTRGSSYQPMIAFEERHDTDAKTLLGGTVLPAGQTAAQDLQGALDNLFLHPNVAPFISRRLIQRLMSSNPSPGYIDRVAAVFENNGSGMRGDLRSVVYAILIDSEARSAAGPHAGKPREPLLRLTAVWRAFGARAQSGKYVYPHAETDFFQAALRSPSVFNFFRPDFRAPGEIADSDLYSPEFQIQNESQSITGVNVMTRAIRRHYLDALTPEDNDTIYIRIATEKSLATDPAALVSHLDLLLLYGRMSAAMRGALIDYLETLPMDDGGTQRAVDAIFLVATSPEFAVQR